MSSITTKWVEVGVKSRQSWQHHPKLYVWPCVSVRVLLCLCVGTVGRWGHDGKLISIWNHRHTTCDSLCVCTQRLCRFCQLPSQSSLSGVDRKPAPLSVSLLYFCLIGMTQCEREPRLHHSFARPSHSCCYCLRRQTENTGNWSKPFKKTQCSK